jgi:hypothetical protein
MQYHLMPYSIFFPSKVRSPYIYDTYMEHMAWFRCLPRVHYIRQALIETSLLAVKQFLVLCIRRSDQQKL